MTLIETMRKWYACDGLSDAEVRTLAVHTCWRCHPKVGIDCDNCILTRWCTEKPATPVTELVAVGTALRDSILPRMTTEGLVELAAGYWKECVKA